MQQTDIIAPSILSADFAHLGMEVDNVIQAGADWIHFDVMDNHYVPNLTIGPMVCEALKKHGITVPIDVHLMVKPVDALIDAFAKAGADYITFHPDATDDPIRLIRHIQQYKIKAGLALNPNISDQVLDSVFNELDLILVMSVYPGFGGQAFMPSVLEKIQRLRQRIDAQPRPIRLSVDGGINCDTIEQAAKAGSDTFVAGSAIFNSEDYTKTIALLKQQIKSAR